MSDTKLAIPGSQMFSDLGSTLNIVQAQSATRNSDRVKPLTRKEFNSDAKLIEAHGSWFKYLRANDAVAVAALEKFRQHGVFSGVTVSCDRETGEFKSGSIRFKAEPKDKSKDVIATLTAKIAALEAQLAKKS